MPDWHPIMFQMVPVLSVVIAFFLGVRSRLDKIEVRMGHFEDKTLELAHQTERKMEASGCAQLHREIDARLVSLRDDVRALLNNVIDLAHFMKVNGNSGSK